jgi:hypothetical protein
MQASSFAAFEEIPAGSRAFSMANASAAFPDPFCLYINPSALAVNSGISAGTFATRLFGLPEMTFACCELNVGRLGVSASSFGSDAYREATLALGCGFRSQNMCVGISAKEMLLSIKRYGSDAALGIDVGVTAVASEKLTVAASGKNVNLPRIGRCLEEIPLVLRIGSAMHLADGVTLCMGLSKEGRAGLNFSSGQEFSVRPDFLLRAGISTQPFTFSAGFGLLLDRFSVEYSLSSHRPLGLTHGMTIVYSIGGR